MDSHEKQCIDLLFSRLAEFLLIEKRDLNIAWQSRGNTYRSCIPTNLNGDTPTLLPGDFEIIIKSGTPIILPENKKGVKGFSSSWVSVILMDILRIFYNSLW